MTRHEFAQFCHGFLFRYNTRKSICVNVCNSKPTVLPGSTEVTRTRGRRVHVYAIGALAGGRSSEGHLLRSGWDMRYPRMQTPRRADVNFPKFGVTKGRKGSIEQFFSLKGHEFYPILIFFVSHEVCTYIRSFYFCNFTKTYVCTRVQFFTIFAKTYVRICVQIFPQCFIW